MFSEFLREYRGRPHAQSRRAVQRRDQVPGVSRPRPRAGRRPHRDRPLRAGAREATALYQLLKAEDGTKDQSYFLYRLDQAQLARDAVSRSASLTSARCARSPRAGLPNHDKKDSTGICFIGERPFREFLNRYLPDRPGRDAHARGRRCSATTIGLMFYTIGQRQGSASAASASGGGEPWYVAGKDPARNRLIVVQGHDHPALYRDAR